MNRIIALAKEDAFVYMSFKKGTSELMQNGRWFSNYAEDELVNLISSFESIKSEDIGIWTSNDVRSSHESSKWINVIIQWRTANP
jgi:hypothetical protein